MTQVATVEPLAPPRRRSVLESIRRGEMIWSRWPSPQLGSAFFHPEDAKEIVERGWVIVDGVKAEASYMHPTHEMSSLGKPHPPCPYTVSLMFEQPFRTHP